MFADVERQTAAWKSSERIPEFAIKINRIDKLEGRGGFDTQSLEPKSWSPKLLRPSKLLKTKLVEFKDQLFGKKTTRFKLFKSFLVRELVEFKKLKTEFQNPERFLIKCICRFRNEQEISKKTLLQMIHFADVIVCERHAVKILHWNFSLRPFQDGRTTKRLKLLKSLKSFDGHKEGFWNDSMLVLQPAAQL